MNETRFQKWMNAVDDDLLEEAQQPIKKKRSWLYSAGAIAACLAVAVTAVTMTHRGTAQPTMITNPMHESSAAEFQRLGYSIPPAGQCLRHLLLPDRHKGKRQANGRSQF